MTKRAIQTEQAPTAIGPYSQAIVGNDVLFTSGQLGIDPETGVLKGTLEAQTHQMFQNLQSVLHEAGTTMEKVLKTTVFLNNMDDFELVNKIYATYFLEPFPARSAVQVARLPKDALVEIEAIAAL